MPSKSQARQHLTSKTVKEKALSPRPSLSFRDKIKHDISNRPPRPDGKRHQEQMGKVGNKKEELVKNMSSLPGFLQREENPQDKILNFGVLDWERLEKWKHKQQRSSGQSRAGALYAGSSSYNATSIASGSSKTEVLPKLKTYFSEQVSTSSEFLQDHSRVTSRRDFTTNEKHSLAEQQKETRKDKSLVVGMRKKKSHKTKALDSYQRDCSDMGKPSSKLSAHEKTDKKLNEPDPDPGHHHKKQESFILLLPKDFSQSGGLDEFQSTSVDENSAELNWSSFSDVFSIGELHFEESTSDIPHSCPLPFMEKKETEMDINFDTLINDRRMHLPSDHRKRSAHRTRRLSASFEVLNDGNKKEDLTFSVASTKSSGVDLKSSNLNNSNTKDPSLVRQLSSSIGRLSRSLSFREGSTVPQLKHVSIRSGPAQVFDFHDNPTDNTANANDRRIISPFKKLLQPLLKPRAAKPVNSSLLHMENLGIKGLNEGQAIKTEKSGSTVIKAVLQLTLKSGLPLFKFLVEANNEILASTVKRLSPLRKNDPSWLYSFYSVQEAKKKVSGWRNQGCKGKSSEFSYNIIGQMKMSEPLLSEKEDNLEEKCTRESVLYGVDVSSKVDEEELSESAINRELGAIVINIPTSENIGETIEVILPSAAHSLPNDGGPASLIHRYRSGGVCDCGGWDVGCKLQVLTNQDQDDKHNCNLFLQGAGEESRHVFRLAAHGEGVYVIEYDSAISSLQAFAISVSILSNKKQSSLCDTKKGHYRSKSCIIQGEGTRYATHPPHSPVSRA